jgi:ElaA protein
MMTSMPEVATEWQNFDQLTTATLYELLRFRQAIFVVEQGSPYPDLDGLDRGAWHLLLRVDGALTGYLRLIPAPPPVRIGRVTVAVSMRGRRLGHRLMEEALLFYRAQYSGLPVVLTSQAHLVPFYRSYGFEPSGAPFDDFGVVHVAMELRPLG